MPQNYYKILGVPNNATDQQIRSRFRQLARQRHPDRFQGGEKEQAEGDFQAITEAFNTLIHPARRRDHDLELARPEGQQSQVDHAKLGRVYLQRGVRAYRDKNYLDAADNFDRATKADPDNAQAWYNLALACGHHPRWRSRAITAIARACELEPMKPQFLRTAGRLHDEAGMASRALGFYEQALNWGGEDAAIRTEVERLRKESKKGAGIFGRNE